MMISSQFHSEMTNRCLDRQADDVSIADRRLLNSKRHGILSVRSQESVATAQPESICIDLLAIWSLENNFWKEAMVQDWTSRT